MRWSISTAIDYPNARLHLGHCFEKIGTDILARYHRAQGYEVLFSTGIDEHSTKIELAAERAPGSPRPRDYVTKLNEEILTDIAAVGISYSEYIRTDDPRHQKACEVFWKRCEASGDLYKKRYEGFFCQACDLYYTPKDIGDTPLCPEHKIPLKKVAEENWFFKFSRFTDEIRKLLDTPFLFPEFRRNEMKGFMSEGLQDISVSRMGLKHAFSVPGDPDQKIYVWFDALINYLTVCGFPDDEKKLAKWWPMDLHVVGKDINRWHTLLWPAMLMSAGIALPKRVYVHGFVLDSNAAKMSKSLGNVVNPIDMVKKYGRDSLRYALFIDKNYGQDITFGEETLVERHNGDLAHDIANLFSRSTSLMIKKCGNTILVDQKFWENLPWRSDLEKLPKDIAELMDKVLIGEAMGKARDFFKRLNKYFDEMKPWAIKDNAELAQVLGATVYGAKLAFDQLRWVLIDGHEKISGLLKTETTSSGITITITEAIKPYPTFEKPGVPMDTKPTPPTTPAAASETKPVVASIDDLIRLDLRVGHITNVEDVPNSEKLWKLTVNLGEEKPRTILSGIKKFHKAEDLVGKHVTVVCGLPPRKMAGIFSEGMILAAGESANLLLPTGAVTPGMKIS